MHITAELKSVYGQLKVYPVCAAAMTFAEIAGTKTLCQSTLRQIKRLGYEIQGVAETDWTKVA